MLQLKKILAQPQANFTTSYLSLSFSTDFMQINCDPGPVGGHGSIPELCRLWVSLVKRAGSFLASIVVAKVWTPSFSPLSSLQTTATSIFAIYFSLFFLVFSLSLPAIRPSRILFILSYWLLGIFVRLKVLKKSLTGFMRNLRSLKWIFRDFRTS